MEQAEVLIIGAGPVGIEVAWHLKLAGLEALHVDAGAIGHTIQRCFPPSTRFFSSPERLAITGMDIPLPAQEKVTGEEYLAYLRSVVLTRELAIRTFCRVASATPLPDGGFQVALTEPCGRIREVMVRRVVLASGGTDRPRRLGVPGEDLPHVHTFLGDPHRFFQRRVLIVGGRNSAIESALRCWRVHAKVAVSYRGEAVHERVKYWLRPEVLSLIKEGRIEAFMPTQVVEIHADRVVLERLNDGALRDVPVDDVLLQIGFEQDDAILRLFGVQTTGDQAAPVLNEATLETNVPGVYVAGTAIAGTQQRFAAYIETSHDHGARIAAAMTGAPPPPVAEARVLPEA
jgi:thioredoxin reductase (NADPH)